MARSGKGFPQALEKPFLDAAMGASLSPDDAKGSTGLRNRDAIQRWVSSPALIALFDPPWTSPFLAGIRMLHPLLGSFALVAVAILIALALVNQWSSRMVLAEAHRGLCHVNGLSDKIRTETDMSQSMGIHQATYTRWQAQQSGAALTQLVAANLAGTFGAVIKIPHMFLQSAILGPSAYLVLQTAVSPGAMIASSVLMGRALARAPTPVRVSISAYYLKTHISLTAVLPKILCVCYRHRTPKALPTPPRKPVRMRWSCTSARGL